MCGMPLQPLSLHLTPTLALGARDSRCHWNLTHTQLQASHLIDRTWSFCKQAELAPKTKAKKGEVHMELVPTNVVDTINYHFYDFEKNK